MQMIQQSFRATKSLRDVGRELPPAGEPLLARVGLLRFGRDAGVDGGNPPIHPCGEECRSHLSHTTPLEGALGLDSAVELVREIKRCFHGKVCYRIYALVQPVRVVFRAEFARRQCYHPHSGDDDRLSLGPLMLRPPRSTVTVYRDPGSPADRSVIVPFWSVRYQGTPCRLYIAFA